MKLSRLKYTRNELRRFETHSKRVGKMRKHTQNECKKRNFFQEIAKLSQPKEQPPSNNIPDNIDVRSLKVKLLFHRALAKKNLKKLNEALLDLNLALSLEPGNPVLGKLHSELRVILENATRKLSVVLDLRMPKGLYDDKKIEEKVKPAPVVSFTLVSSVFLHSSPLVSSVFFPRLPA